MAGYLEVVVNPTFNLAKVAALTQMPLKIYSLDGKLIYQSAQRKNPAGACNCRWSIC